MAEETPRYHALVHVLPQHEQHYPDKRLPHRLEEYVLDDGRPPTTNRLSARFVTGQQVLDAIIKAQADLQMTNIDPRYYVGTCFHEAGCENEWDTEIATASCVPGFVSVGAYQIGQEEAGRFGFKLEDMLDLDKSSSCMIQLAEYNRKQVRIAAKLIGNDQDPDYTDANGTVWKAGTMRAYLAIAHNHGVGYMHATVARYGLDWGAYKTRNPADNIVNHHYGEDAVTGGPQWPGATPTHRLLYLTQPLLIGSDVTALQNALLTAGMKVTADGVFGSGTDANVREFQRAHGLIVDGKVGQMTRDALGL